MIEIELSIDPNASENMPSRVQELSYVSLPGYDDAV